jgi:hypothetical protein
MTRDEARSVGLKRYAGRLCAKHNCAERYVGNDHCVECQKKPRKTPTATKGGPSPYIKSRIINCLRGRFGGWITTAELVSEVYGTGDIDNPVSSLMVLIWQLRNAGFPIASAQTRGYRYAPELWQPLEAAE